MIIIPVKKFTAYTEDVTLDGLTYRLRFRWNSRDGAWYLSIAAASGESLLDGIKLVSSWELIGRFVDPRLPPGRLAVLRTNKDATLDRAALGVDFQIVYLTEAER